MGKPFEGELPEGFQLGTGIKDDYNFIIDHSYFGTDATYMDGKRLLLIWEGRDADTDDPQREILSVGEGWTTPDLGRTMIHPKNLTKVNNNSVYGKLMKWAVEDGDTIRAAALKGNTALQSDIWNGMKFHMGPTELKFGKNLDPITKTMPVEFLGVEGDAPKAASTSGAASTAPTPSTSASNGSGSITEKLLTRLAANSPTFEDFVNEALDIPNVMSDTELRNRVSDESDAGFYATHKG